MPRKIFTAILLTTLIFSLTFCFFTCNIIYEHFETELISHIRNEALLTANALELAGSDVIYLESTAFDASRRVTLTEADGTVLYDSRIDKSHLENHINRSEIAQACKSGTGEALRLSSTLNKNMYYFAVRLNNDNIIRISAAAPTVHNTLQTELPCLMITVLVICASAALLIVRAKKLNKQASLVDMAPSHELEQAIDSISFGIAFIAADKTVLYANKYAAAVINRISSSHYGAFISNALHGISDEKTFLLNKRIYKFSVNAVRNKSVVCAAIIFISDITTETESKKQTERHSSIKLIHDVKKTKLHPYP